MALTNKVRFLCEGCKRPVDRYWGYLFRISRQVFCLECSDQLWDRTAQFRDPTKEYKK